MKQEKMRETQQETAIPLLEQENMENASGIQNKKKNFKISLTFFSLSI